MVRRHFFPIGGAILAGFMLLWSFPDYNQGYLAWVAFVPLFLVIAGRSILTGFLLALVSGTIFLVGYFRCNLETEAYTYLHHALLAVLYGPLFALLGLGINYITQKVNLATGLLAAPFIFVCLEFTRANLSFLAMPMGLLPYSQYLQPLAMQIASVTSAYGISFLIVMVNAGMTALVLLGLTALGQRRASHATDLSTCGLKSMTGLTLILSTLAIIYGHFRLSTPLVGQTLKVAVVQPNIPQAQKWQWKYRKKIMQTLVDMTMEAVEQKPQLIVWPED